MPRPAARRLFGWKLESSLVVPSSLRPFHFRTTHTVLFNFRTLHQTRQPCSPPFRSLQSPPNRPSDRSASTSVQPSSPPPSGDRPFLTRDPNRELPSIPNSPFKVWSRTLPVFFLLITVSCFAIFNYQKSNSSVVSSILYALRRNEAAKEILGDEIYFANSVPWISGEMNQLHGRIDVKFWVKGTRGKGRVRFWCERKGGRSGLVSWLLLTFLGGQVC